MRIKYEIMPRKQIRLPEARFNQITDSKDEL